MQAFIENNDTGQINHLMFEIHNMNDEKKMVDVFSEINEQQISRVFLGCSLSECKGVKFSKLRLIQTNASVNNIVNTKIEINEVKSSLFEYFDIYQRHPYIIDIDIENIGINDSFKIQIPPESGVKFIFYKSTIKEEINFNVKRYCIRVTQNEFDKNEPQVVDLFHPNNPNVNVEIITGNNISDFYGSSFDFVKMYSAHKDQIFEIMDDGNKAIIPQNGFNAYQEADNMIVLPINTGVLSRNSKMNVTLKKGASSATYLFTKGKTYYRMQPERYKIENIYIHEPK